MEIDISTHPNPYHLITSTIIPRPIGWVSSLDTNGVRNLAPYSFFNGVSGQPPMLIFSAGRREGRAKDTLANVIATNEFVWNVVSEHLGPQMNLTSGHYPSEADEFTISGLTPIPSVKVKAPRVKEAYVTMECVLVQTVPLPRSEYTVVIGEVVYMHIADEILDANGRVDPVKLNPIARLGGSSWYTSLGRLFEMKRPP